MNLAVETNLRISKILMQRNRFGLRRLNEMLQSCTQDATAVGLAFSGRQQRLLKRGERPQRFELALQLQARLRVLSHFLLQLDRSQVRDLRLLMASVKL